MNKQTQTIYEAYQQVVNEAAESKFKVGDKVGIGSHNGGYGSSNYQAIDTGTVTKVNKSGHHTVEYDTHKSQDDAFKPKIDIFNDNGVIQHKSYSGMRDGTAKLYSVPKHTAMTAATMDKQTRSRDLHKVQSLMDEHKLGSGHYAKLSKSAAAHMKELIDLHTGEEV